MTGGYWPADRASVALPHVGSKCPRCSCPVEDSFHLIWSCPANARIESDHVRKTQSLIQQAREGYHAFPCLWLRGLLPSSLVPNNTPYSSHEELTYYGTQPQTFWPAGVYHTDGSGGIFSAIPALRRCGVGVVFLKSDLDASSNDFGNDPIVFAVHAPLVGTVQTVPRAELYAVYLVLDHVGPRSNVNIVSDSAITVDLFELGRDSCMRSVNSDMWEALFDIIASKELVVKLTWIKSHWNVGMAEQYPLHPIDLLGNTIADKLADAAASQYRVLHNDSMDLLFYYELIRKIQARALTILSIVIPSNVVVARPKSQSIPRVARPTIGAAALGTSHAITTFSNLMVCRACHQRAPVGRDNIIRWLASTCTPEPSLKYAYFSGKTRPVDLPNSGAVRVGRQVIHQTHKLKVHKGLIFCVQCGYYASNRGIRLISECTERGPTARNRVLNHFRGILPSGVAEWPNDRRSMPIVPYSST